VILPWCNRRASRDVAALADENANAEAVTMSNTSRSDRFMQN
jgi:hypothetical protein